MSGEKNWPLIKRALSRFGLVCICAWLLTLSFLVSEHIPAHAAGNSPTMNVSAGFDGRFKNGSWLPVRIALANDGPDFTGQLSIDAGAGLPQFTAGGGGGSSSAIYRQSLTLPNGARKLVTMVVPSYFGEQKVTVDLLDSNGQLVRSQSGPLRALDPGATFVGLLSDQQNSFGALNNVALPNTGNTLITEPLSASTWPEYPAVLKSFDLVILDNFTTSTLNRDQMSALQDWVDQGGSLLLVGGPEWQPTFKTLPAQLLPVTLSGTATIPAGTHLLPLDGQLSQGAQQNVLSSLSTPTPISQGRAHPGTEILLTQGATPLIVQAHYGQGSVGYVAFDPTLEPVASWAGASSLWKNLLLHLVGDRLVASSLMQQSDFSQQAQPLSSMGPVLQALLPNSLPPVWWLFVIFLGYLFILGPVRFMIVRRLKRRDWSWRIALVTIILFSLFSYGLALYQKGTSTLSNSVSVMQFDQDGARAHSSTYAGVFVPNQGDFQLQLAHSSLVQPANSGVFQNGGGSSMNTLISSDQNGTSIGLQNVNIWTQYALLADQQDMPQGGIRSNLTLRNNLIVGTVTNTLPYGLNDVNLLFVDQAIPIGLLAAGQTVQVNALLAGSGVTGSLADQIAQAGGLTAPYTSANLMNLPQGTSATARHAAILASLSGEDQGGYQTNCGPNCTAVISNGGASVVNGVGAGSIINLNSGAVFGNGRASDALLLPGAAITLIGWADAQAGDSALTVNGGNPDGVHERLVQIPLDMKYDGLINLPTGFINGRLIDAQGTNLQTPGPGVYGLSQGSMTFDFTLGAIPQLQMHILTLALPNDGLAARISANGGGQGKIVDGGTVLQARLFNWRTGAWDTFTLHQGSISIFNNSAYLNANGRVLLKLSNQDSSLGTIVFSRPLLGVQGAIAP